MLKIKKIKPMFNAIVTTMNRYEEDMTDNGVIVDTEKQQGSIKEFQTVVAVGSTVRDIKVGDLVSINPTRFGVKKHQEGSLKDGVITDNPIIGFNFDIIEINDAPHLLLQDRDINYIIEDSEEIPDTPASSIVLN
jgi:hypothetical protein